MTSPARWLNRTFDKIDFVLFEGTFVDLLFFSFFRSKSDITLRRVGIYNPPFFVFICLFYCCYLQAYTYNGLQADRENISIATVRLFSEGVFGVLV